MMIAWILFGLIEMSLGASIAENAKLIGLIGYFTQTSGNQDDFNFFSAPIVFYPILQKMSGQFYLPRDREAIEAVTDSNTGVTGVTDRIELTTPESVFDDIPAINSLPLDQSPPAADLLPQEEEGIGINTDIPLTIPLPPRPYGYGPHSNPNVDSITFTTSHPPVMYPLNIPSQLHQFRPSPQQTNHVNHFRPSHYEFGLPDGNTNFITGKSRLDNFPISTIF